MSILNKLRNFLFGEHSLRQTMFKNSLWLTVSNMGSSLIKAVLVIYAARLLGASEYGLFSYALSIAATFTIFSDLGLNYLITINMAQRVRSNDSDGGERPHEAYFPTLLLLRVGLLGIILLLTVGVGPFITKFPQARMLIPLVALLVAFDDLRGLLNSIARAENRMDKEAFGYIVTNGCIVVLGLVGLRYSPTSYILTLAYLAGSTLGTVLVFFTVKEDWKTIFRPLKFSLQLAKNILAVAIPFGLANALWALMTNTDALMIGWFRSAAELGYYAAAQRPISILSLVPSVLAASSLSLIARLAKDGARERLQHFVELLIAFSLAIVLPIVVGGIVLAPAIIQLLYGAQYAPAVLSFILLLVTLVILYPSTIVTNLLLSFKQQQSFTIAMVAGALANAILDFILIPPFGIAGSVVATLGALSVIYGYIWKKTRQVQPFKVAPFLGRIFPATVGMGIVTFALNTFLVNFILNIAISGVVYLGILAITKEPLLAEIKGLLRPG